MQELNFKPQAHLFICTRERKEGKDCCSAQGAEEMVDELKSWVKKEGLKKQIKVSRSSCLGYCESGITACIYPQNQWFHQLTPSDIPQLKTKLLNCLK